MKGKKCFGLLLLLSIIVGLSLNVSSDVSAYQYVIDSIPIRQPVQRFEKVYDLDTNSEVYSSFYDSGSPVLFVPTDSYPSGLTYPNVYNFSGSYNSVSNTCELLYFAPGGSSADYSDNITMFGLSPLDYFLSNSSIPHDLDNSGNLILPFGNAFDPNQLCSIYGVDYNSTLPVYSNYPHWDFSGLASSVPADQLLNYRNSTPYFYNYDHLTLRYASSDQGMNYVSNGLKMSDIFNVQVPQFQILTFNLDLFNDDSRNIMNNVEDSIFVEDINNFRINGTIDFFDSFTLSPNATIGLQLKSFQPLEFHSTLNDDYLGTLNNVPVYELDSRVVNITCNYETSSSSLTFSCYYVPTLGLPDPIDFEFVDLSLTFSGCEDFTDYCSDSFVTTNGDYSFTDFYVVTNNNYTPYDMSASGDQTGGNTSVAPGGSIDSSQPGSSYPAWFSSLVDMFNFSVINPFTPIFGLFTNQSTCANIPTIASMIHSEETQVCPWFSAETRAIVTPVVGIVSMMLIFGFVVRWLGARSGNFFEDTTEETIGRHSSLNNGWGRRGKR